MAVREELVTELADVYEVLDALMHATGISQEQVQRVQADKRAERGEFGEFKEYLKLLWTEEGQMHE